MESKFVIVGKDTKMPAIGIYMEGMGTQDKDDRRGEHERDYRRGGRSMKHDVKLEKEILLLRRAIQSGGRHFEFSAINIPHVMFWKEICDKFNEYAYPCLLEENDICRYVRTYDYRNTCFFSIRIPISTKLGPKVDELLTRFVKTFFIKEIDVLYLENPFGGDANVRRFYKKDKDDPDAKIPIYKLFMRNPETGKLLIRPSIQQSLWLLWKRMEKMVLRRRRRTRFLGLRNFSLGHIMGILKVAKVRPSVVQVPVNAYNMQRKLRKACQQENIVVVSSDPFDYHCLRRTNQSRQELVRHEVVVEISMQLGMDPRVILIRYLLQSGVPAVFDSEDFEGSYVFQEAWQFSLSERQMLMLDSLDRSHIKEDRTKVDIGCSRDPMWPFMIPKRKKRISKPLLKMPKEKRHKKRFLNGAQEEPNLEKLYGSLEENERTKEFEVLRVQLAQKTRENILWQHSNFGLDLLPKFSLKLDDTLAALLQEGRRRVVFESVERSFRRRRGDEWTDRADLDLDGKEPCMALFQMDLTKCMKALQQPSGGDESSEHG